MERARVFRTTGPIRILWGLTLLELMSMLAVASLVTESVHWPLHHEGVLFAAAAAVTIAVIRTLKFLIKPNAARHFASWLREDDHYHPQADDDVRPLVWRTMEE